MTRQWVTDYRLLEGMEQKRNQKKTFWYPAQNTPARARCAKRLGLVWATPWADFAVITAQLKSTMTAFFPCVTLFWKYCSLLRIIVEYCQPQKKHTIWIQVSAVSFSIQLIWTHTSIFCAKELQNPFGFGFLVGYAATVTASNPITAGMHTSGAQ